MDKSIKINDLRLEQKTPILNSSIFTDVKTYYELCIFTELKIFQ